MTTEEARKQAKALLNATDAMLAGLLQIASQLRESVAILADTLDTLPTSLPVVVPAEPESQEPESFDGHLTTVGLVKALAMAGQPLAKTTVSQYASRGIIPYTKSAHGHRLFQIGEVLKALETHRKRNVGQHEDPGITERHT